MAVALIRLPLSTCYRHPGLREQTLANGPFNERERFLGLSRFGFRNFGAKLYSRQLILLGFNTRLGLLKGSARILQLMFRR
jgi:hypothetical protein